MDVLGIIYDIQESEFNKRKKNTKAHHVIKFIDKNCECGEFYKIADLYKMYTDIYGYMAKPWFMEVVNANFKTYIIRYKKYIKGGERKGVDFIAVRG